MRVPKKFIVYLKDSVPALGQFSFRVDRDGAVSLCFCLVAIAVTDLVLIGLMTIWLLSYSWIPDQSCLAYCF